MKFRIYYLGQMELRYPVLLALTLSLCTSQFIGLHSDGTQSLSEGEYLMSPDGKIRAYLNASCQIEVKQFNQTLMKFVQLETYDLGSLDDEICSNISLKENSVEIDGEKTIASLPMDGASYTSLDLIIQRSSQFDSPSILFRGNKPDGQDPDLIYIYPDQNQPAPRNSDLQGLATKSEFINEKGWKFTFSDNQLSIQKSGTNQSERQFDLGNASISISGIKDGDGEDRYAVIQGMTLHPRANASSCQAPKDLYLQIDDVYPVVRILDGKKYQVIELGLKDPRGIPTVYCPKGTFRYQDKCQTSCPNQFLKEIRNGQGQCVLSCEEGSTQEENSSVCTSINYNSGITENLVTCSDGSEPYEFGCKCKDNKMYSSKDNLCVSECPQNTFGLPDEGICVSCPQGCSSCQLDLEYRSFLACKDDQPGKQCSVENCYKCGSSAEQCLQCNPFYSLDSSKNNCLVNCPKNSKMVLGPIGEGYCVQIPDGMQPDDFEGVYYEQRPHILRTKPCQNNTFVFKDKCVKCPSKKIQKQDPNRCKCEDGRINFNGQCLSSVPPGFYFQKENKIYLNCQVGCITCEENKCEACEEGYILVYSSGRATCRRNSALFICDSNYFVFDEETKTCISNKEANKEKDQKCLLSKQDKCVNCQKDYSLKDGKCQDMCPDDQYSYQRRCYKNNANCAKMEMITTPVFWTINNNTLSSDAYSAFTKGGVEISNDPAIQIYSIRENLEVPFPDEASLTSNFSQTRAVCIECKQGYIFKKQICIKETRFKPFTSPDGELVESCPADTHPTLEPNIIQCVPTEELKNQNQQRLKIDASVYPLIGETKLFYFVISEALQKGVEDIKIKYYEVSSRVNNQRLLQGDSEAKTTSFKNRTYIAVESNAEDVVLDFRDWLQNLISSDGSLLGEGVKGVTSNQNHVTFSRNWLAIISYIISITLIILHCIYIGNTLLYKVDNALIFAQGLYFFSFINLTIGAPIAQYYYGFLWSHFGFFPNYFKAAIPHAYYEGYLRNTTEFTSSQYVPNVYRLLGGDVNFIRHAGFAFSLLATFLVLYLLVILLLNIIKLLGRYEVWYSKIAKQALFAAIEFVAMTIVYWAVAHLLYNQGRAFDSINDDDDDNSLKEPSNHPDFRRGCSVAAIIFIILYVIYMIGRWFFNKIAGLYMFKRVAFAVILAASANQIVLSSEDKGIIANRQVIIALTFAELIFMALRFSYEKPYLRRQKFFIIVESIAMIASYFIMYFWNDTGFITIYNSIILFLFIVFFIVDLIDVYNDSIDQFYEDSYFLPGTTHKPVRENNQNEWREHMKREEKRNENPWTNSKIKKPEGKKDRNNEGAPSERQMLNKGKQP